MSHRLVSFETCGLNGLHPKHVTTVSLMLGWNGIGYMGAYRSLVATCVMLDAALEPVLTIQGDSPFMQTAFDAAEFVGMSTTGRIEYNAIKVKLPLFDMPQEVANIAFKLGSKYMSIPPIPSTFHLTVANHKQDDLCHLSGEFDRSEVLVANFSRTALGWDITGYGVCLDSSDLGPIQELIRKGSNCR